MPARLRLCWSMKTFKLFLLPVFESLEFGCQVIRYALVFVSAFFRQRASLGCEIVAMQSQLTFYEETPEVFRVDRQFQQLRGVEQLRDNQEFGNIYELRCRPNFQCGPLYQ